jgi:cytidyltransferase-like protein
MEKKYRCGLYIGRFQPLHIGHCSVIEQMLAQCKKVIICIGSAQEKGTRRNPFSFGYREGLIEDCYPYLNERITIVPVPDRAEVSNDSSWGDYVFARVKEWCGAVPDAVFEGEEAERVEWWKNTGAEVVIVSRDVVPISASELREMIAHGDDQAYRWLPHSLDEYVDDMRKKILEAV